MILSFVDSKRAPTGLCWFSDLGSVPTSVVGFSRISMRCISSESVSLRVDVIVCLISSILVPSRIVTVSGDASVSWWIRMSMSPIVFNEPFCHLLYHRSAHWWHAFSHFSNPPMTSEVVHASGKHWFIGVLHVAQLWQLLHFWKFLRAIGTFREISASYAGNQVFVRMSLSRPNSVA